MRHGEQYFRPKTAVFAVVVFMCFLPSLSYSAGSNAAKSPVHTAAAFPLVYAALDSNSFDSQGIHPGTPMVLDPASGGFSFDLGGSDTPKLQLQLAHPLVLEAGSQYSSGTPGARILGLDATIRMPVAKGWNLQGGMDQALGSTQFHSLGSIQCLNGTLKPDSYTAYGCRFVSESDTQFDRRTLNLGATHESDNMVASANWFTTQTEQGSQGVFKLNQFNPSPSLENRLVTPVSGSSIFPNAVSGGYLASETTGIDLNFQVGFATSQTGGVQLGLALTRVLDANYQATSNLSPNPLDWRLAEAFDSAALGPGNLQP